MSQTIQNYSIVLFSLDYALQQSIGHPEALRSRANSTVRSCDQDRTLDPVRPSANRETSPAAKHRFLVQQNAPGQDCRGGPQRQRLFVAANGCPQSAGYFYSGENRYR